MDLEDLLKEDHRIACALPPGPWHARGNTITAGADTVAVVFARPASLIAHYIAKFPDMMRTQQQLRILYAQAVETIEALTEERNDLKLELETAHSEVKSLREDLSDANNALDDRLAGK